MVIFRSIKDSIHSLNSHSPFKDAFKNNAPNFVPENVEENKELIASRIKAKPPVPIQPLSVIKKPNEQGRISYLKQ